jgi:hypothetical protein
MFVWPVLTALGFAALTAVVIVLGVDSTARYEQERQQGRQQPTAAQGDSEPLATAQA